MRTSIVLLPAALVLAACAPAGGTDAAAPGAPSPTEEAGPAGSAIRSCAEPGPDRGPVDLRSVDLAPEGDGLTATFALAEPPSTVAGVLELSLGIWNREGAAERALEVRWVGGVPQARVYDAEQAREEPLPVHPSVAGGTVTVHFPPVATAGLGPAWRWEAFASVDGTDVDTCPGS